ncbi:UDP-glucuronosyl/UDP-glucosyltransferase [Trema orientale]|uniref:UDP-glucuronosyl/UDP-glucosyltransferase n=1 Tax=Trema orientale TaxID=63057 RepID=A0A2P5FCJ3_TREOI|nr:UDP-glucuronosyl/UDP-glucosyltransferase [Trema orientale]
MHAKKWRDVAREAVKEGGSSDMNLKAFVAEMIGEDALILALGDPLPLYEDQNILPGPPREPGRSTAIISAISRRRASIDAVSGTVRFAVNGVCSSKAKLLQSH